MMKDHYFPISIVNGTFMLHQLIKLTVFMGFVEFHQLINIGELVGEVLSETAQVGQHTGVKRAITLIY